ncbi:MAG: hypothetical protein ACTJLN_04150 [Rickettsia amblyommatis]
MNKSYISQHSNPCNHFYIIISLYPSYTLNARYKSIKFLFSLILNWRLHNVCITASAVSSGLVVPDVGHLERVSDSSLIKWVCYLGDMAASSFLNSIATALIAVLHDAGDNIFNSKEEKKLVDVLN